MGRRAPREAAGTPVLFASLGSPDYRHLWGATACSQAAVWALVVRRAALVYELTQSNAWVGFVTMAAHLPSLVVTPFVGFLADHCERRHLLALTYRLNLGNSLRLALLVITKQASEWPMVVLALVHGILRAVEVPRNQALLPNPVPRERLLNAVAPNQLMQQGAHIFGPLCLLPVIRFVNPETAFFPGCGPVRDGLVADPEDTDGLVRNDGGAAGHPREPRGGHTLHLYRALGGLADAVDLVPLCAPHGV
jgi:MFS family permease